MLNEMKYVYAVYQEKSFSKAARKLQVSQPALSKMVRKVEKDIGVIIFDRSTIPVTVTREGAFYIKSIEDIMFIQRNLKSYFMDLKPEYRQSFPGRFFIFLLLCISRPDRQISGKVSQCGHQLDGRKCRRITGRT